MGLDDILNRHRAPDVQPRVERDVLADMLHYARAHGFLPVHGEERIFAPAPKAGMMRCRLLSATGAEQWIYLRSPGLYIQLPIAPSNYQVVTSRVAQPTSPMVRSFRLERRSSSDCLEYREET